MNTYFGFGHHGVAMLAIAALVSACPGDDSSETNADGSDSGTTAPATSGPVNTDSGGPPPATDDGPQDSDSTGNNDPTGDNDSTGDNGSSSGDSTGAEDSSGSGGAAVPIPDPGAGMDQWQSMGAVDSPGNAWQVGIATMPMPYVEGITADDGNAFFVFEAGPALTELTINAFGELEAEFIHLHDGTGLEFGDEIPADATGPSTATFTTVPGNIYVLELHFPGAGFF